MLDMTSESQEIARIVERMREFTRLPKNWDQEGGEAPTVAAVEDAITFVRLLADEGYKLPKAVPLHDGGISLDFDNLELTAVLDGMGNILFTGETKSGKRVEAQKMPFERKAMAKDTASRAYLIDYLHRIL